MESALLLWFSGFGMQRTFISCCTQQLVVCGMQALQLRQAQAQYREARAALHQGLADTEAALLRGVAPSTLALQPPMRTAPVMAPAVSNGQVPSQISRLG
jgi:hypothetical protein